MVTLKGQTVDYRFGYTNTNVSVTSLGFNGKLELGIVNIPTVNVFVGRKTGESKWVAYTMNLGREHVTLESLG